MKKRSSFLFLPLFILFFTQSVFSQGYLHRDGRYIYDGSGNEVILRGIGTGNWMIQEGYMMQTAGVAGTQHEFREKLINTIGVEKTDSFYTAWLDSHFRRIDVDSMKSWGFNSVRVAMHYLWFTPPIEDEPVKGEITWIETGFTMMDSLLDWCSDNEMYLILDMHGAPGGQGKNADISDYDPTKPSLWESQANKDKLIALWRKLAERYSTEPWMGGYDLINETNWPLANNNKALWDLHKEITFAIREVDPNHIIFIEGNGFANDYNGLPAIWDDNLALSFHKYWSFNDEGSLDWMINLRNQRNVPIWLGESGENSNVWFTELIALSEKNRIGWSWWPVKKPSINNVLNVTINEDYWRLIDYWKGDAPHPGVDAAFNAVLEFAENHRLENCKFQNDVVDAMIRQPKTTETIPYKIYKTGEPIYAVDYNLGRNGFAYFDNDTANYNSSTGEYVNWNQGWSYRNDGVDIQPCEDSDTTNGYNIGWTGNGEWMEYTLVVDSTASYTLDIRSASGSNGSKIHLEMNGVIISPIINLPGTSDWQEYTTTSVEGIILEKGTQKIRFVFDEGGSNLNYFKFSNPVDIVSLPFKTLSAASSENGESVYLTVNKKVTSEIDNTFPAEFAVTINNNPVEIKDINLYENDSSVIEIQLAEKLFYGGLIRLSYIGNSILNMEQELETFSNIEVENNLPFRYSIPRRIQSENFYFNNGLVQETCEDAGGGYNMGYANPGDYLDYLVYVPETRHYTINFRFATIRSNNQLDIRVGEEDNFSVLETIRFNSTGGWQSWETFTTSVVLEAGRYTLRMYVRSGEFNTNWFELKNGPLVGINSNEMGDVKIYPNPASDIVQIDLSVLNSREYEITILNSLGKSVKYIGSAPSSKVKIDIKNLNEGLYFIVVGAEGKTIATSKLIVK